MGSRGTAGVAISKESTNRHVAEPPAMGRNPGTKKIIENSLDGIIDISENKVDEINTNKSVKQSKIHGRGESIGNDGCALY